MIQHPIDADYVLPLRWTDDRAVDELTDYLGELASWVHVLVVDGSPAALYAEHDRRWGSMVTHVRPEPWPGRNGKVAGVMTGVRRATHDVVVIADDDVRYDSQTLATVVARLRSADVVRPQNAFASLPWHARLDTARSLLNRSFGSDYPGTLAVRRDILLGAGGYDGDVLFENLELLRTVRAVGGAEVCADDVFVARTPPSTGHFLRQRVRQAYDDFAQPGRLLAELTLLPAALALSRTPRGLVTALLGIVALAEVGRRRHGGIDVFPPSSALWAPVWVAERAVCVWIALGARARGGVRYHGTRIRRAATPQAVLDSRLAPVRAGREATSIRLHE